MNEAYLLTGGNMGDRKNFLSLAKKGIEKNCGPVVKASSLYETAAWGKEDQPPFLNQVLHIYTDLSPEALLKTVLQLEETMGRKRQIKYGPRIIDIDILFYNDEIIEQPGLHIPHPQMQNRRFVLLPLAEIGAEKVHPLFQKNIKQLLKECKDELPVVKIS